MNNNLKIILAFLMLGLFAAATHAQSSKIYVGDMVSKTVTTTTTAFKGSTLNGQVYDMVGKEQITFPLNTKDTAGFVIKQEVGFQYDVVIKRRGIVIPPTPTKVTVQAETISPAGACIVTAGTGRAIGCTKPSVTLRYAIDAKTGAKLIIKYSSGVTNGVFQVQSGALKKSFTITSTGNFDTYKDLEIDFIPPVGSKDLVFTFVGGNALGNLNLDSFTY